MGIRYYAYPIAAEDYLRALADPCPFHGPDPLAEAWGPDESRPEMLYLDKCWRELQALLGPSQGQPARTAFQLVEGKVTQVEDGWRAYERALGPEQVRAVAADLALLNDADIGRLVASFPARAGSPELEHQYIAHHGQRHSRTFRGRAKREPRGGSPQRR